MFFDRLDYMLRDPRPIIRPYLPGEQDPDDFLLQMDLVDCLDRFVADRRELVTRLETLERTAWARTAEHGEYRTYSVFIMFRHLALHDFLHAYRIEAGLAERLRSAGGLTNAEASMITELSRARAGS